MSFYEHYAKRERNRIGRAIKGAQARRIFRLALDGMGHVDHVLEIGPGDGYVAELARRAKIEYLGIEGSPKIAEKLRTSGYVVINSLVPPMPPIHRTIDLCFMLHVIEHLKDMFAASELLESLRGQMSSRGRLVIATPDFSRWKIHFFDSDYTHNVPFTTRRLRQLLDNTGFRVVSQQLYVGSTFGYHSLPLFWIARMFYFRYLDELLGLHRNSDVWYRGYMTFLPNIVIVAEKHVSS
jgi:hypothetical protein